MASPRRLRVVLAPEDTATGTETGGQEGEGSHSPSSSSARGVWVALPPLDASGAVIGDVAARVAAAVSAREAHTGTGNAKNNNRAFELLLDGFVLPAGEPASLLREDDVVTARRISPVVHRRKRPLSPSSSSSDSSSSDSSSSDTSSSSENSSSDTSSSEVSAAAEKNGNGNEGKRRRSEEESRSQSDEQHSGEEQNQKNQKKRRRRRTDRLTNVSETLVSRAAALAQTGGRESRSLRPARDCSRLPRLKGPPRVNDRICFQILELRGSNPVLVHKEGVVVQYSPADDRVHLDVDPLYCDIDGDTELELPRDQLGPISLIWRPPVRLT
jgi:Coilin N-terminus